MKVLFVTTRFPLPAHTGGRKRVLHQIRHLARTHEVHLLSLHDEVPTVEQRHAIGASSVEVIPHGRGAMGRGAATGVPRGLPLQAAIYQSPSLDKRLDAIVRGRGVDVVVSQMARLDVEPRPAAHVVDFVDALSLGLERRVSGSSPLLRPLVRAEASRMRRLEHRLGSRADRRVVTSPVDAQHLEALGSGPVDIVPVGVGDQFFDVDRDKKPTFDVIFTGNLGYAPNIDAAIYLARSIVPLLVRSRPGLTVALVGARPHRSVLALESDTVNVVGPVDDLSDWLGRARIAVAPMQMGSGVQFKLLEAMAVGLPTVTTSLAAAPLGAVADQELLIADTAAESASAIDALLSDAEFARRLGDAGQQFVSENFRWRRVDEAFEAILVQAAANKAGPGAT